MLSKNNWKYWPLVNKFPFDWVTENLTNLTNLIPFEKKYTINRLTI